MKTKRDAPLGRSIGPSFDNAAPQGSLSRGRRYLRMGRRIGFVNCTHRRTEGNATMNKISRRSMLAGTAGLFVAPHLTKAQAAKPRLTVISQWSAGSDGAAITAL